MKRQIKLIFNEKIMDFSKAWEMLKLQQEIKKIKKKLENTLIESEVDGLVITINWEMKVEKVEFEDTSIIWNKEALEKAVLEAINKWMSKAQESSSKEMKWVMWQMGMNLPEWMPGM